MTAATPLAGTVPPGRLRLVSVAAIEEPPAVSEPEPTPAEPRPLPLTGDDETDEVLALMRHTTGAIHEAQDRVAELSDERKRLVLDLRRRGVIFRHIAQAANSTEQTILKIHREAKRERQQRHDEAEADRLGYPTVTAYLEALAEAQLADLDEPPPFVPGVPADAPEPAVET